MITNLTGTHIFKAFAINPDTGVRTLLGSTAFTNHAPVGVILASSSSSISGWAFDKDEPTTSVQILIDEGSTVVANGVANIDQSALIATIGSPNHGFDIPISGLSAGSHTLTILAVDPDTGVSTSIGTATITV
jgi:hypothetical protein